MNLSENDTWIKPDVNFLSLENEVDIPTKSF